VPLRPFEALRGAEYGVLVVAADVEKEDLLCAALAFITGTPKVIVAAYGHLGFRYELFEQEQAQPSSACLRAVPPCSCPASSN
jgi:hypothetical protein